MRAVIKKGNWSWRLAFELDNEAFIGGIDMERMNIVKGLVLDLKEVDTQDISYVLKNLRQLIDKITHIANMVEEAREDRYEEMEYRR